MSTSQIKLLPEDLINKIAAGEVIERPASVVKELVENALDAGSSKISVEIQSAGRKLIRVTDNGCGMSKEELALSLQRHSTSKVQSFEDLYNLHTLGFRGEALPSIASVAYMEISSKTATAEVGHYLKLEGGQMIKSEACAGANGTSLLIKDLFFNTPARKKFLKSPATEMGHIVNVITRYALCFPSVAFDLIADGKPLFSSPGSGKLEDAILAVFGLDLLKNLAPVKATFAQGEIHGLTSLPVLSRIDKTYQVFFVNHRLVQNFLLNRALEEAYRTLIPNQRHPAAILFIDINPALVDVNVHPSKREVKFSNSTEIMGAITNAVKAGIAALVPASRDFARNDTSNPTMAWQSNMTDILFPPTENFAAATSPLISNVEMQVSAIMPFIPFYQFKNTYILATDEKELILIDQHAAHERILYDRLCKINVETSAYGAEKTQSFASLLIPETLHFDTKDALIVQENLPYLNQLGFSLEEFGAQAFLLRSVPAELTTNLNTGKSLDPKRLLMDIVASLQEGKSLPLTVRRENLCKLVACHGAIKAGDKLTLSEMQQLIKDLYRTESPLTCPHGRPTIIRINPEQLGKWFKRL